MRTLIVVMTLVFVNYLADARAGAIPLHTLNIAALTQNSDTIVIGRVSTIETLEKTTTKFQGGSFAAVRFLAQVEIHHVIKGNPQLSSISLEFAVPEAPVGISGIVVNQFGIFFLDSDESHFRFADALYPVLPALPSAQSLTGSPIDQIAETLGFVLASPDASTTMTAKALVGLGSIGNDYSKSILQKALHSATGDLQLNIARTLVAHNDVTGMDIVKTALLHPVGISSTMIMNLKGSLLGMKDPNAIPDLIILAKSNDMEIRRNAAAALRQTGSWSAVPQLSKLLNVNDVETQYYAVVGLGEITQESDWTPSFAEFQENRNRYVSHWITWKDNNLH